MTTEITNAMVAEVLEKAADLLVTKGWCKGYPRKENFNTGSVSYCTLGAIYKAMEVGGYNGQNLYFRAQSAVAKMIVGESNSDTLDDLNIINFNDQVAQGVDDVTDVLLRAAKDLRNAQ